MAILGLLSALAVPSLEIVVKRHKEQELKNALMEIRTAIDQYKQAVDQGKVTREADESGYPPNLNVLYQGVLDMTDPNNQKKIYFLRRLPRDPFYPDNSANEAATWGKRSYESSYDSPHEGKDVYDIYSMSPELGINGIPYKKW